MLITWLKVRGFLELEKFGELANPCATERVKYPFIIKYPPPIWANPLGTGLTSGTVCVIIPMNCIGYWTQYHLFISVVYLRKRLLTSTAGILTLV